MTSSKKRVASVSTKGFTFAGSFTVAAPTKVVAAPSRPIVQKLSDSPKRVETYKNSVDPQTFGFFWDRVEGVPSWISFDRVGQSPTGYPDDQREPPRETNMVEDYKKTPHVDNETKEVWKVFLGLGGLLLAAVCAIIIMILWHQVPPQMQSLITWVPDGLMAGSRVAWSVTIEFVLVVVVALKRRAFKDALLGGFKRL